MDGWSEPNRLPFSYKTDSISRRSIQSVYESKHTQCLFCGQSVSLSVCLSVCLSVYLSVCLWEHINTRVKPGSNAKIRLWLEVRVRTPNLKYCWTRAPCDCERLQFTNLWCDSEVKFLSNDYTDPNTNPKTHKTLNLTQTDLHDAFEIFCAPVFCYFTRNYSGSELGPLVTSYYYTGESRSALHTWTTASGWLVTDLSLPILRPRSMINRRYMNTVEWE